MRIAVAPYAHPEGSGVEGALLRVQFPDDQIGYADLHPYPELGDPALKWLLTDLSGARLQPMIRHALYWARWDAEARARKASLVTGESAWILSHRLVRDVLALDEDAFLRDLEQGFTHFKLKMGKDLPKETERLKSLYRASRGQARWRIDFNARLHFDEFQSWAVDLPEDLREAIDFVEDPSDFSTQEWSKKVGLNLALDRAGELEAGDASLVAAAVRVLVVKPELHVPWALRKSYSDLSFRYVITSNLAHPLSFVLAVAVAEQFYRDHPELKEVCGLLGWEAWRDTPWMERLKAKGPRALIEPEPGLGYRALLEKQKWQPL